MRTPPPAQAKCECKKTQPLSMGGQKGPPGGAGLTRADRGCHFPYAWQDLKDLFKPIGGSLQADIVMGCLHMKSAQKLDVQQHASLDVQHLQKGHV
ncbi:MAG: hypothetical protein FRX49_13158 [Trebouxia sp. A1-2]|nr:MAG: hypothetical protein FRX49_13158 [Trebouxia sp. A1-2]